MIEFRRFLNRAGLGAPGAESPGFGRGRSSLGPVERWSLHLSALAVGLSGVGYGWLKYFHQRSGEFGPEPFPLQGWLRHGHVLAAPVLVFTLGVLVRGHVLPALKAGSREGRSTGLGAALALAPMIMSGYGIQVCVDPVWHAALAWIHGLSSAGFLLAYAAHLLRPRAQRP